MYKQKIGISLAYEYGAPIGDVLGMIKTVGFDAVSPIWTSRKDIDDIAHLASGLGLELQSLHAPFGKAQAMWDADERIFTPALLELKAAVDACAELSIPVTVVHTWIGFEYEFSRETLFFGAFDELVRYAKSRGVSIAFESTEPFPASISRFKFS